jgi:hypothetical protein
MPNALANGAGGQIEKKHIGPKAVAFYAALLYNTTTDCRKTERGRTCRPYLLKSKPSYTAAWAQKYIHCL